MAKLPTLVLVHSPLVGPSTWESTAVCLRERGFPVVVSSLAGVANGGPPYYRRFAEAAVHGVVGTDRDSPVVLVGHSAAGALLPTIAEELEDRVQAAVFVDAILPHPEASWFETAPQDVSEQLSSLARAGRLPPWNEWFPPEVLDALLPEPGMRQRFVAELPSLPVAYFEESAPLARNWSAVRCAYVRLSGAYDRLADDAERRGWWVHREHADHLAMVTQPDTIADVLARAVAALNV